MRDAVRELFGDAHQAAASLTVGAPVVYRLFVSSRVVTAPGPTNGQTVTTYHDVPIRDAVATSVAAYEVVAGGQLQVGDQRYEFPSEWLARHLFRAKAGAMSAQDRIDAGGRSLRVVAWDDSGPVVRVTVRR